jgi:probable F420-dependent oxidoreductase
VSGPAIDLSVTDGLYTAAQDAGTAENLGCAGLWTAETTCDPFLPAAPALAASDDLMVGTGVAIAFARSPMTIAQQAHDLHAVSGGRFVLGLGSQIRTHITKRYSMPWGRPIPQMRDMIGALRAIFAHWYDGDRLEFEGEYYRHTFNAEPFRPRVPAGLRPPPIHLAAVGPRMTALAGEVADGYVSHSFTTASYLVDRVLPALAEGRARRVSVTDGDTFDVTLPALTATGRGADLENAIERAKRTIAIYGSTPAYRGVLDHHGLGALQDELHALSRAGRWSEMPGLIEDQILELFAVVGEPTEVAAVLLTRFGPWVTRLRLPAGETALASSLLDLTASGGATAALAQAEPHR